MTCHTKLQVLAAIGYQVCAVRNQMQQENGTRKPQIPRKPLDPPISWIVSQSLIFQIADPFCVLGPHRFINDHFSVHVVAAYSSGPEGRLRRWGFCVEYRWPRNFIIVPRIRTVTKYKIEKLSVVTGDRTHNLHLPRLAYIPLVHLWASHRRNKLYIEWTTTALIDWLFFPTIKIRPVVHEKQLSGFQIRISIPITPNFELGLPMINTSLLTKFHQNPTSCLWEILLTNKLTNKHTKVIAISRFSRDNKWHYPMFFEQFLREMNTTLLSDKRLLLCERGKFNFHEKSGHFHILALSIHKLRCKDFF